MTREDVEVYSPEDSDNGTDWRTIIASTILIALASGALLCAACRF